MGKYLIFNPFTGQHEKAESFQEAQKIQQNLVQRRLDEFKKEVNILIEGFDGNNSVLMLTDSLGNPILYRHTNEQLVEMYGRSLTVEETAAWENYHKLLDEVVKQEGYPFSIKLPPTPTIG
jgi:hypothetical protein